MSGKQIAAGALGVGAILGLAACSTAADPTISGSVTASIEQSMFPSAAPVDISDPETIPAGQWPAESADYSCSEEPQGGQEQWLEQNWPDFWARGVRAVTTDSSTTPRSSPYQESPTAP